MREKKFYELEGDSPGLVWLAQYSDRDPIPYCKHHRLRLVADGNYVGYLVCPEDKERFNLRFDYESDEAELARQKIFHDSLESLDIVRIDPQGYQVVAKESDRKNPDYWVEAKLSNTSRGLQLMVQAGKKNSAGEKVQLFVEPAAKRMDFDRGGKDIHPAGLFTKVTAEFIDSRTTIAGK